MEKLRIMSVFGTRPEAIKMAPLVKELASRDEIESLCCVTAQHREMLDSVMEVFDLKADCDLDIMTPRQTLSTITSKCLLGMDDAIEQLKPDMILVHGDTSTTFAGALSAFYHKVPVGHVEAGLRTYDKYIYSVRGVSGFLWKGWRTGPPLLRRIRKAVLSHVSKKIFLSIYGS